MKTAMYAYRPDRTRVDLPEGEVWDRWLDPAHSAIACIDMHRSHVDASDEIPCPAPRAWARVGAHNAFHRAARRIGVPVIHVQHWQRHGGIDDIASKGPNPGANWRWTCQLYLPDNPLMDELAWEGTRWVDLMVEEVEGDLYVRSKKRLSAFYPTDFEFLLRQLDVHNLVLTGTLTDCCVINSAFDAANRDFRVIVPQDVVAGMTEVHEEAALTIIASHLGLVVDAPALLGEWYARAGADLPDDAMEPVDAPVLGSNS
ncbi:MAG: isochorismatase family cysteine hydrolase [Solirubrobacterales bacterium]